MVHADGVGTMRAIAIIGIAAIIGAVAVFVSSEPSNSQSPIDIAQPPAAQAGTPKPSFDCAKAIYPDERAICSNTELSQLDNLANAGYEYVRRVNGNQLARSFTLPLLQARRACGSDVACIKTQQLAAIQKFQSLGAPVSGTIIAQPQQLLWNQNGSTAYLIAKGNSRKFFYKEPKPEMWGAGAKPDALIFEGKATGEQYQGTAYLFDSRCGKQSYQVSGPILDEYRRVELHGQAPRFDSNCHITGYADDLLEFKLIAPAVGAPTPPFVGGASASSISPSQMNDAELRAQEQRPEVKSLRTTVWVAYLMLNCYVMEENDVILLINSELKKLNGIDPVVQLKTVASAKLQAAAKTSPTACSSLKQNSDEIYMSKQAVREARIEAEARSASTQSSQPSVKQESYATIYTNEVARQRLVKLTQEISTLYFAIGCGVIKEDPLAPGLLGAKAVLIWPQPGDPLFDLHQPNQYISGQALFFGIPPEIVDHTYMEARHAGLSKAGADPDALIVRQFRVGAPGPPMRIPLYSGPVGNSINCVYWRENPQDVVSVHQLANYLNLRYSSGQVGYQ